MKIQLILIVTLYFTPQLASGRALNVTNTNTLETNKTKTWPQMQIKAQPLEIDCPYLPQCNCNRVSLNCTNFNYFYELNFTKMSSAENGSELIFKSIRIIPQKEQELNEKNLNLNGLAIDSQATIELANINNFYFKSNPFARLNNVYKRFTTILILVNCTLKFSYDSRTPLNSVCNRNLLKPPMNLNEHTVHSLMSSANFVYLKNCKFVEPICPFIFNNVKISNFYIINPQSTDFLRFLDIEMDQQLIPADINWKKDKDPTSVLNCRIKYLFIENANLKALNSSNMNKYAFYNVKEIKMINVRIQSIDEKVFANFHYLNRIELDLKNWPEFLSNVKLDIFLNNLNSNLTKVNFEVDKKINFNSKFKIVMKGEQSNYDFPDKDFCYFADFPFNKLIIPYFFTPNKTCSCTILWTSKYFNKFPAEIEFGATTDSDCKNKSSKCDFKSLKETCDNLNRQKLGKLQTESNFFNFSPFTYGLVAIVALILCVIIMSVVLGKYATRPKERVVSRRRSRQSDDLEMSSINTGLIEPNVQTKSTNTSQNSRPGTNLKKKSRKWRFET